LEAGRPAAFTFRLSPTVRQANLLTHPLKIDFWSAFRDNLDKSLDAFPQLTEVRITSQHLHRKTARANI
jgi:hypothetical protein